MKRFFLPAIFILIFNSCNNEDTLFDPTYFGDGFKGITFTSPEGPDPLKEDPSDWCFSHSLIKENDTEVEVPTPVVGSFGPAYPNPCNINSSFKLRFSLPGSSYVDIYIINKYNQIVDILVNQNLNAGIYEFTINCSNIGTGVYRIMFESVYLSCSGDVWIKN